MEELGKLLALVSSENEGEATKLLDAIRVKIKALDGEMVASESKKLDAIKSRDEVKGKLNTVLEALGTSDITAVNDIVTKLKDKSSSGTRGLDDIRNKELETLKGEIVAMKQAHDKETGELNNSILGLALSKDIAVSLPKYRAKKHATEYIINEVKKSAHFDDGKLIFRNDDGTTKRSEGRDANLDDIIKTMRNKEKESNESLFFDISPEASGAGGSKAGGNSADDFIP